MSYDLYMFRRMDEEPVETLATAMAAADGEATPDAAEALFIGGRKLADAFLASKIPLEESEKDYEALAKASNISEAEARELYTGIELDVREGSEPPLQIMCDDHLISLSIPYWDLTPERKEALLAAWSEVERITKAHSLIVFDPQTEEEANLTSLDATEQVFSHVQEGMRQHINQTAKKPWWKFW